MTKLDPELAGPPTRTFTVSCDRSRRGPFTAGASLLGLIVPELLRSNEACVRAQARAVVTVAPELAHLVPPPPETMTTSAPRGERTRYFSASRPRFLAEGVAKLVTGWVAGQPARVTLRLTDLDRADATDAALVDVLARRCQHERLQISVADPKPRSVAASAGAFLASDGSMEAPGEWEALNIAERARRHDARAAELARVGEPGTWLGAIPYHLERGSDPAGAGADAWHRVLESCFDAGFYDAAVDAARRGLALVTPESRPGLHSRLTLRLIAALSSLGRVEEALEQVHSFKRTTTSPSDQMQCCYNLAMLLTRHPSAADPHQALEWANTAIAFADADTDLEERAFHGAFMRNARALVELHLGHPTTARELVEQAITLTDDQLADGSHRLHRTVLVHNRGRVSLALGDVASALRDFDAVVAADPFFEDALFDRAGAHTAAGDLESAVDDYTAAIGLRDTFIEAYVNRAELGIAMGRHEAAVGDLDAVLALDPDHVQALTNRAGLLLDAGHLSAAMSDIRHGLVVAPGNVDLICADGVGRQELGDTAGARDRYDRALSIDPQHVPTLGNRATLAFDEERYEDCLNDLERALALAPSAPLLLNRGLVRQALGRHTDAIADFTDVLVQDADEAEALFLRGRSRLALGDPGGRDDWCAHLAALGPDERSAHSDELTAAHVAFPMRDLARQP